MATAQTDLSGAPLAPAPEYWDSWLTTEGTGASFCQSTTWATINNAVNAVDNYWVEIIRDGRRVAGALLSRRRPDYGNMSVTQRAKIGLTGAAAGWLDCFEGPVLTGPEKRNSLAELLAKVETLAIQLRVHEVRFHGPPVTCSWSQDEAVLDVFRDQRYKRKAHLTALVDLGPSEESMSGRFKRAARKGIRKCEQSGIQIEQCQTRKAFVQDFCVPYHDDAKEPPDSSRALAMWDINAGQHYRFFVAKDAQGRVLATLGTYSFNGLATEIMSHRTKASFDDNLPAQDLLHWHIFKTHRAAGDRWFDLAGYSSAPATDKEAGIRRFKEKWGGREIAVPQFVRTTRPRWIDRATRLSRWTAKT